MKCEFCGDQLTFNQYRQVWRCEKKECLEHTYSQRTSTTKRTHRKCDDKYFDELNKDVLDS